MSKVKEYITGKFEKAKQNRENAKKDRNEELLAEDLRHIDNMIENWQNIIVYPKEALNDYLNDPISWDVEFRSVFQKLLDLTSSDVERSASLVGDIAKEHIEKWTNERALRSQMGAVSRGEQKLIREELDMLSIWADIYHNPGYAFTHIESYDRAVREDIAAAFVNMGQTPTVLKEQAKGFVQYYANSLKSKGIKLDHDPLEPRPSQEPFYFTVDTTDDNTDSDQMQN